MLCLTHDRPWDVALGVLATVDAFDTFVGQLASARIASDSSRRSTHHVSV